MVRGDALANSAAVVYGVVVLNRHPTDGPSHSCVRENVLPFSLGAEHHTYTIIGRCPRTSRLGIGIATFSLAVGGYCPYIKANVAAVSTQAFVNPRLGPLALRLLETGHPPAKVLDELGASDPHIEYRQIGIVDRSAHSAARTGKETRPWAGHIVGNVFVAMGNALAGEEIVQAIADWFQDTEGEELDSRLLRALEAGHEAGGQRGVDGRHLTERSAGIIMYHQEDYPYLDLRVDAHELAVEELRRVHTVYMGYVPYYEMRTSEPHKTPPQEEWTQRQERGR